MTTEQQDTVDDWKPGPKMAAALKRAGATVPEYGTPTPATDLGVQDTADLAVARARIKAVAALAKSNASNSTGDTRRRWLDVLIMLGES